MRDFSQIVVADFGIAHSVCRSICKNPFVGNGISRIYGLPSWQELTAKMFKQLADYELINHNQIDLLKDQPNKTRISIADHCFEKVGDKVA